MYFCGILIVKGDNMKVLKKGREQKSWATTEKCSGRGNGNGGCGAKLLVEKTDLYQTCSSHYDGSTENYTTFTCPICSVETDVDSKTNIPFYSELPTKKEFFKNKQSLNQGEEK